MKMFKTYMKARKAFKWPKMHVFIGPWKRSPCLPMWRRGNVIRLCKKKNIKYYFNNTAMNFIKDKNGKIIISKHKVNHDSYCDRKIRKKLKKLHLSWIPVEIQLPLWLSFYWFDMDVCWKTKYDEIRYEFPPQCTLVLFGFCISLWLNPMYRKEEWWLSNYHYWECLLNYVYEDKCPKTINGMIKFMGLWHRSSKDGDYCYRALQKEYIREKFLRTQKRIKYKLHWADKKTNQIKNKNG